MMAGIVKGQKLLISVKESKSWSAMISCLISVINIYRLIKCIDMAVSARIMPR